MTYLNILSFAAVLNNSLDRDAGAERCEVSLQLTSHVSDGTAWHRHWERNKDDGIFPGIFIDSLF